MQLKSLIGAWIIITLLLSLGVIHSYGQPKEFKFPTKFISFKHAALSMGADVSFTGRDLYFIETKPDYETLLPKDNRFLFLGNVLFDIYAPNSLIGFEFGLGYKYSKITMNRSLNYSEFSLTYITVPFFIKIRPGNHLNRGHFLMLLGANYNLPLDAKVKDIFSGNPNEQGKNILTNQLIAEVSLGYEYSMGKKSLNLNDIYAGANDFTNLILSNTAISRFYFYFKGGYALNNTFVPTYIWDGYSVGADWNLKTHYVALGFCYYFRLTAYSEKYL